MVELRPVRTENVNEFREVRLRALLDSPLAFGPIYQEESRLNIADWQQRAVVYNGNRSVTYLAWKNNEACGIATGFLDAENPLHAHLVSVWVDPRNRQIGIGKLLVEAIIDWGKLLGVRMLYLMVNSVNPTALGLYESKGFRKTGRSAPYPDDPIIIEFEMSLDLEW